MMILALVFLLSGEKSGQDRTARLQAKENALAILSFENKTGDTTLNWLTAGLPEMLLTDLSQSGAMKIIGRSRIVDQLDVLETDGNAQISQAEWLSAAEELGATIALSGSVNKLGERIRIDAHLDDVETEQHIKSEKVVGKDLFVLVDSLTLKIAQMLNAQELLANNREISTFTSSSPKAYQEYLLGMQDFENSLDDAAIAHFQKAIAIDSTFALPWMRIGMVHVFRGRQQQGMAYFAAAGQYERGRETLARVLSGPLATTDGFDTKLHSYADYCSWAADLPVCPLPSPTGRRGRLPRTKVHQ